MGMEFQLYTMKRVLEIAHKANELNTTEQDTSKLMKMVKFYVTRILPQLGGRNKAITNYMVAQLYKFI